MEEKSSWGKHAKTGGAPRHTRRTLEGFEASPVHYDDDNPTPLMEGAEPPVRQVGSRRPRGRLERDLEPVSRASRHAAGTAVLGGAGGAGRAGDEGSAGSGGQRGPARRRVPVAAKVLLVLLALIAVIAAACWAWVSSLSASMSLDEEDRDALNEVLVGTEEGDGSEAFYTLILGSDARQDDTFARSDVLMLARVDVSSGLVTFVSIPRDTMVYDESGAVQKINAAYNEGPAAAVKAVSEFAGVDISHYVEVDFEGLESVVDALGGVLVDVPEDIEAGNGGMSFSAGEQVMDGEQALAYARERYTVSGGDFGRAQAQRQIATAIVKQVLASNPLQIPGLVSSLASSITTDLSIADIVSYAMELQGAAADLTLYSAVTPSYALEQDGVSYVATMYVEWGEMMRRTDAGLDPSTTVDEVPAEQRQNERLGAATNAAGPRDYAELAASSPLTSRDTAG